MFETNVTPLNAIGSFSQGYNSASEASGRQQQLDYQKQLFGLEQQKAQQEMAQKQAIIGFGQEAAVKGNPQAIAMFAALNPEGGKVLLDLHKQNTDDINRYLGAIKSANVEDRNALWQTLAPKIQQNLQIQGLSNVQLPANYSPEIDPMISGLMAANTDLKDRYNTVESTSGLLSQDKFTGQLSPTGYGNKPDSGNAASGGATGALIDRLKKGDPTLTDAQALQLIQTGYRSGTQIDSSGNTTAQPGFIKTQQDIKGGTKLAEKLGETQATELGNLATAANTAQDSLNINKQTLDLLDKGTITGFGADYKLGFGKALQAAGIHLNDDAIANTETFAANTAQNILAQTKKLGSGTGFSDNDLKFLKDVTGAHITLNEQSIRRIVALQDKQNNFIINKYNTRRDNLGENLKTYLPDIKKEVTPQQSKSNVINWGDLK